MAYKSIIQWVFFQCSHIVEKKMFPSYRHKVFATMSRENVKNQLLKLASCILVFLLLVQGDKKNNDIHEK